MSVSEARTLLEPAATQVLDPLTQRSMWLAGLIQWAGIGPALWLLAFAWLGALMVVRRWRRRTLWEVAR